MTHPTDGNDINPIIARLEQLKWDAMAQKELEFSRDMVVYQKSEHKSHSYFCECCACSGHQISNYPSSPIIIKDSDEEMQEIAKMELGLFYYRGSDDDDTNSFQTAIDADSDECSTAAMECSSVAEIESVYYSDADSESSSNDDDNVMN